MGSFTIKRAGRVCEKSEDKKSAQDQYAGNGEKQKKENLDLFFLWTSAI